MTEEKPNKLTSRKFLVWVVWTILEIALLILGGLRPELINSEIIEKSLGSYALVTSLYIGGNVATKGLNTYKEVNGEAENE